jgi:hypothetical protein
LTDNPYQPPTDAEEPGLAAVEVGALRRQSVLFLVLVSVLSWGIYAIFWLVKTTRAVNRRVEQRISPTFVQSAVVVCAASYAVAAISLFAESSASARDWDSLDRMATVVQTAFVLVWVFRIRRCLNVSTGARPGMTMWVNGFFTFVFQQFYLQYKINVIAAREARRATAQAA